MNRLLSALLALSLFTFACPEPTEPDPGNIVDPEADAGPAPTVADGTVTVTYLGAPMHLRVQTETIFSDTPSYLDGGAVWAGTSQLVVNAQASDSVSGANGTSAGTSSVTRVDGGVVFTHTANVQRAAVLKPVLTSMGEHFDLCVSGPAGKQARLDVQCQGTETVTGAGMASLLVGSPSDDGAYCKAYVGTVANAPLPKSGTATKTISSGKVCFDVWLRWMIGHDVSDSSVGTAVLAGGKVTVTGTLLP